jgi:hypothetical protein
MVIYSPTPADRLLVIVLFCLGSYCLLFAEDLVNKKLLEAKDGTPDLDAYGLYEQEQGTQGGLIWAEFLQKQRAIKDKERMGRMQKNMQRNQPKHGASLEMAEALKYGRTQEVTRIKVAYPGLFL